VKSFWIFIWTWHFILKGNVLQMNGLMAKNIRRWPASIESCLLRIADAINSRGWIFVGIIGIAYLFMACYQAKRKLFWFDEIFTVYISRLPDFSSIVDALKHGADFNPPLFYEWIRVSAFFLNDEHLATRMPSILGVGTLCLCLYRFVSIRSSAIGGLVAGLFPLVTGVLYYSYEARAHGIVIGFAGLALVCWQSAIDPAQSQRRIGWLLGLGLALVSAALTHGYAIVIFAALVLAELYRCLSCKRIDWAMFATFALASTAIIVPFWMLHVVKQYVPATFFAPSFTMLANSYISNLGKGLPIIALAFGAFLCRPSPASEPPTVSDDSLNGPSRFELTACLGFVASPVIVFFLSLLTGAPLLARYSLSCVIGFAALAGFSVSRKPVIGLYLIILMTCMIAFDFLQFHRLKSIVEPSTNIELITYTETYFKQYELMTEGTDRLLPIVISDDLKTAPLLHYSPLNLRQRLTLVLWGKGRLNHIGYKKLQDCCHSPGQVADGDDFIKLHKTFLAFTFTPNELTQWLKLGATITLLKSNGAGSLFFIRLP
jgi:Dolichyl-phosphate-mannose-protein mannosyltransferase